MYRPSLKTSHVYHREWEDVCGEERVHSGHQYLLWGVPLQQRQLQQFNVAVPSLLFAGSSKEALYGRGGGRARLSRGGPAREGEETKKGLLLHITKGQSNSFLDVTRELHSFFLWTVVSTFYGQQQLSVKEFYLKIIPWRLFTFRVCPGTKVTSDVNHRWKTGNILIGLTGYP